MVEKKVGSIRYNLRKVTLPLISVVIFLEGVICLLLLQIFTLMITPTNPQRRQHLLDYTKRLFIVILATILAIVAPSGVRITRDKKTITEGTVYKDVKKGRICSILQNHSISICNHQIYTDWIFLWWLAYTSNLGGNVYIMLKKSLENIPLLGFGMKNFDFIFMSRKWINDKLTLERQLGALNEKSTRLDNPNEQDLKKVHDEPYNLILFPEGTVLSPTTRSKSLSYGQKIGREPFSTVLLPHETGLRFSLQNLQSTLDILYDVTIGYSGVRQDEYGENVYGLKSIFLEGHYPKMVDIHIRAFNIEDIPFHDETKFSKWLYKVWEEKNKLLNDYYKQGSFDLDPTNTDSVTDSFKISSYEFFGVLICPILTLILLVKFIAGFIY
ncbi:putative acyltransferase NDAI_0A06360 [Naumovozyma dairenensis CBS 421]|uniref:Phospholipid/glycerol acyltransferase domain-containing protein n=1 Tax=Naumovozyma dairenensis (strain ATCC 10597 / BCRC 20456 / CBS 421 / NBRC 0211 / NRRL Y-12639) TaxID=1071378 RepID=G0W4Q2_NAUDC|nr:hypothetical protein NDAI_0A06360 [Naumovozyma dairenensis CBS 421]CCD22790.1 hypothetical protein NDAI_0A06360 [Naumovozyma dairenensis CBS 421]